LKQTNDVPSEFANPLTPPPADYIPDDQDRLDTKERRRSALRWVPVFVLLLLAGLALAVDLSISRLMVDDRWPQPWQSIRKTVHNVLEAMEPFGQPTVVIAVSLAVMLCGGANRGIGLRIAVAGLCSGLVADLLKTMIARIRPRNFDFAGSVADTFQGFLPGTLAGSPMQSWPSAHTATAVGFCLALSTVFPRGKILFFTLAAFVAIQRIETASHFLSDTLCGAAVGYVVWWTVFFQGPVASIKPSRSDA
jgi:membrane-associated phospholipid phosphatase